MPETGIDGRITSLCRKIRYLEADMRCEITGKPLNEQGSEISRPHMHHFFFGPGIPWLLRHNPDYLVCLSYSAHQVNIDCPHKDNYAFRRKYFLKLQRDDELQLVALKAEEERFKQYKKGTILITTPTPDQKKKLLTQLKLRLNFVTETSWMDIEACQVPPGMVVAPH